MCGIAGLTGAFEPDLPARLAAALGHRGPDGGNNLIDASHRIGLAHARLAVIDTSTAAGQPMESASGRHVIAFNGEIYNYAELRSELEAEGHVFRTHSDTEVLLELLERRGESALERLVGMFAFALLDRADGSLLLVRDRLGIKPLVWAPLPGGEIAFASEIQTLSLVPGVDDALDHGALSEYLACLYVPAPATILRGVRKLPPGHLGRWRRGGTLEIRPWWRPSYTGDRRLGVDEAVEELLPLLRRAVRDCMVSDVPVGCFLSGGIDSSIIAALMAEARHEAGESPLSSFTMTFEEAAYDEREAARAVANHIGSQHTELPAGNRPALGLDRMVRHFGEPFGNPTALLIADLSQQARQHVTVALVGDGGDEVFAGYPRYQGGLMAGSYRRLPGLLRRGVIEPAAALLPESTRGHHTLRRIREFIAGASRPDAEMYAGWVEYFTPEERRMLLGDADADSPIVRAYRKAPSSHPLDAMQQTDLETFLPGNLLAYGDAMSMMHALELRLPLLDHRLIEQVGRMDPGLRFAAGKKTLLKGMARRLLPAHIIDRPKLGFNPPIGAWLRGDLSRLVNERLDRPRLAELGLDHGPVETLLREQQAGRRDNGLKIWALLVLESWDRQRRGGG
jgi:asparagine synthase (glutamine-hydrolysing)